MLDLWAYMPLAHICTLISSWCLGFQRGEHNSQEEPMWMQLPVRVKF